MFVDRVKNDPKFREAAFKLQKEIGRANDPGNHVKTYFDINEGLTLDTRTKGEDSRFDEKEMEGFLKEHEVGETFKQQEDEDKSHPRYNHVRVIAQSLAFTKAGRYDAREATKVINEAYNKGEVEGEERFRLGNIVDEDTMISMIKDPECNVLLAEVPDGKGVVKNGAIIGVCVYSTGSSAGTLPGTDAIPGAIRFLAVAKGFAGLCIGERTLRKAERNMVEEGVGKIVFCVPGPRKGICKWAMRRGYMKKTEVPYPVDKVPFKVIEEKIDELTLVVFEKSIREGKDARLELGEVNHKKLGGGENDDKGDQEDGEQSAPYTSDRQPIKLSIFEEAEAALRGISFVSNPNKLNFDDFKKVKEVQHGLPAEKE